MGAIEALYDGKKIEFSVEVTKDFEQEAETRKQFAWVVIPISVLLGVAIALLIKKRKK